MDAYTAYSHQAALTAPPERLVLMLFDGALARIDAATSCLHTSPVDFAGANVAIGKAQRIVEELAVTLDRNRGGEVAANLAALYRFCLERLLDANLRKDPAPLGAVADVLGGIRDAWAEACLGAEHAAVQA